VTPNDNDSDEDTGLGGTQANPPPYGRGLNTGRLPKPMEDQFEYQHSQGIFDTDGSMPHDQVKILRGTGGGQNNYKKPLISMQGDGSSNGRTNGYVLTQYNLNDGLRHYGERGEQPQQKRSTKCWTEMYLGE